MLLPRIDACSSDQACQQLFQKTCKMLESDFIISSGVQVNPSTFNMIALGISMVTCFTFSGIIWRNKKLQAHPLPIIMWIGFLDATLYLQLFMKRKACAWKFPELFAKTVLHGGTEWEQKARAV